VDTTQSALDRLARSTEAFLALLDGASDAQWRLRPPGAEWSLADTVEHVVLASRGVLAQLTKQLLASPLPEGALRLADAGISADMFRGVPAPVEIGAPAAPELRERPSAASPAPVSAPVLERADDQSIKVPPLTGT
jgi:hypothetical protein